MCLLVSFPMGVHAAALYHHRPRRLCPTSCTSRLTFLYITCPSTWSVACKKASMSSVGRCYCTHACPCDFSPLLSPVPSRWQQGWADGGHVARPWCPAAHPACEQMSGFPWFGRWYMGLTQAARSHVYSWAVWCAGRLRGVAE